MVAAVVIGILFLVLLGVWLLVPKVRLGRNQPRGMLELPPADLVQPAALQAADDWVDLILQSPSEPGHSLRLQTLSKDDAALSPAHSVTDGFQPTIPIDKIVEAVPSIMTALNGGQVVRIIGPQHLLDGLRNGTYRLLESGGALGTASDGKKIVGNLRFSKPSNLRTVAAPAAVFQIASALTMQYYLNVITSSLRRIEKGIANIKERLQNKSYGKIEEAKRLLESVEHSFEASGNLSDLNGAEVAQALRLVGEARHECMANLQGFCQRIGEAIKPGRKPKRGHFIELLEEASGERLRDFQLLLKALSVQYRLLRLRVVYSLRRGAADIDPTHVLQEFNTTVADIHAIRDSFGSLCIDESKIPGFLLGRRTPKKRLVEFKDCSGPLLEQVRELAMASREEKPFVIECHMDERGQLAVRHAFVDDTGDTGGV